MNLHDPALEIRALKTVCSSTDKVERARLLSRLSPEYFHEDDARAAFIRVKAVLAAGGEIPEWDDLLSDPGLASDTRKELGAWKRVKPIHKSVRIRRLYDALAHYHKARALFFQARDAMRALDDDEPDVEGILESVVEKLVAAQHGRLDLSETIHVAGKGNDGEIFEDLLSDKKQDVIPTGFSAFDDENGGFFPGSMVVLAATTGGGKSALALNMAMNMASRGKRVCVVPLEMTKKETLARVYANVSGITLDKFLFSRMTGNEKRKARKERKRWKKELKRVRGDVRIWEPPEDVTLEDVLTLLGPYNDDVVVVDYIGLLKGADGDDQWRQLGRIARYAKIWARNNDKVVVLLAQLNEEGMVKYSRTIREHANNCWTWVSNSDTEESEVLEVRQTKARNQKKFNFPLRHDFSIMRITDVSFKGSGRSGRDYSDTERYLSDESE